MNSNAPLGCSCSATAPSPVPAGSTISARRAVIPPPRATGPARAAPARGPLPRGRERVYSALTGMVVPLTAMVLGKVTVSSPFLKVAVTLPPSMPTGSQTVRANRP